MWAGEPVTALKLVGAGERGVLPASMRAISTCIKEEAGAGRLILPNDHVEVILARHINSRSRRGVSLGDARHWPACPRFGHAADLGHRRTRT